MEFFLEKPYFYGIIALTVICSLIGFYNHFFFDKNKFSPFAIHQNPPKNFQRFFTAGFLHADFMHLILNMYVFFSFGSALNFYFKLLFEKWGDLLFVTLYIYYKVKSEYEQQCISNKQGH